MSIYITASGRFLPGPAIDNNTIEDRLGRVEGKDSRLKSRILAANGIQTRHYALDAEHNTTHQNEELAATAATRCLDAAGVEAKDLRLLACATSQGDLALPGFGSMVQAQLEMPAAELFTSHGICSASMMALKTAWNSLRVGDHQQGLVVASELPSRMFKHTRYEAAGGYRGVDFQAEFLRWMLSDGAGALFLDTQARPGSLRIDWIHSFSHADAFPVCMSVGGPRDKQDTRRWLDFPSFSQAEAAGAILIRQDLRLLEHIVKLGVDGALRLIAEGTLDMPSIDHFLCHYSSHHFKGPIADMLDMAGASIPEEKWYTNLYTRGNTGCASMFIMLDEFLESGRAQAGDRILCMVPESGRFNTAYMQLTVTGDQ